MSIDPVTIASNRLAATISPAGAELTSLTLDGDIPLQWSGDPAVWKGRAPILFPAIGFSNGGVYHHAGATYAMPKHGFARDHLFEVAAQEAAQVTLRLDANDTTRPLYPFDFRLDLRFAVNQQTLTIEAIIANRGDGTMPASFGFHPAFRWPLPFGRPRAQHTITFACDEPAPIRRIGADGLVLPSPQPSPVQGNRLELRDSLFTDDAMIFDELASRSAHYGAADGPRLRIDFPDFPMLGVWTKPGADFICIEPWHGLPDPAGYAGDIRDRPGVFMVDPGAERVLRMAIGVEE